MYILQPYQYRSTVVVLFLSFQCVISRTKQAVCMDRSQKSSVRPSIRVYMGTPHFAVYTGKNCIMKFLEDNIECIQHIQVSQCPNRDEPCNASEGDLNYSKLYRYLDETLKYSHYVGLGIEIYLRCGFKTRLMIT